MVADARVPCTLDPQTGIHGPPRLAHPAFNLDSEQARASIRKLERVAGAR